MEDNLTLMYFMEENELMICNEEFEEVVLIKRVRLPKNRIKELMKHKNFYVYVNVAFKCPLKMKDIDDITY